jgi:hypothetical protein
VSIIIGWFCGKEILLCWRKQRYNLKESAQDSIVQCLLQLYSTSAMVCLSRSFNLGLSPYTSSSQYSQLSIESEIRLFHRTNLHRSSLLTSFFFTSDIALLYVCQLSVQHTPVVKLLLIFNLPLNTHWDCPISISWPGCCLRPTVPPHL